MATALSIPLPPQQTTKADWRELPRARQQILLMLYRCDQMLPLTELSEMLALPDLDQHIDDMRRYVQRVYLRDVPIHNRQPNGVALTVAGLDLVRWGAKARAYSHRRH